MGQQRDAVDPGAPERMRTSDLLSALAAERRDGRVSVGEIIVRLGERSFGVVILVLALPAWIPVLPPGVPSVFGVAIAAVALQMLVGREVPWVPGFVGRLGLPANRFARLAARAMPWLRRVEAVSRQRGEWAFERPTGRPLVALFCLGLALAISVPLPMTNSGPALSLAVIALGFIERDGVAVLAGIVLGVVSVAVIAAFWSGALLALRWLVLG